MSKIADLETKIKLLEAKIAMLEARPVYVSYPVYVYPVHPIPYNPQPWITYCGGAGVGVHGGMGNVPTIYAGNVGGCNPVGQNYTVTVM